LLHSQNRPITRSATEQFTLRERQILELLATGLTDKEIANQLHMSMGTLRTHLSRLFLKSGQKRRTGLVAVYLRTRDRAHQSERRFDDVAR